MATVSILALGADAQRQVREQLAKRKTVLCFEGEELELKPVPDEPPKPSKWHNKKTRYRSIQGFERVYDSMLEASTAANLDAEITASLVRRWLPQMPILLPGGVRLVVDFLVWYADGRVVWKDAKGRETQASINKRKQAMDLFGIEIEMVRR